MTEQELDISEFLSQIVDTEATHLAATHGLESNRVRRVLEDTLQSEKLRDPRWRRIVDPSNPDTFRAVGYDFLFSPSLSLALNVLPPQEALDLFANDSLSDLKERESATYFLSCVDTPLFTLTELADLLDAFIDHLECPLNRDALIARGKYQIEFSRSWWLHAGLSNNYYTKIGPDDSTLMQLGAAEAAGFQLDPCGKHSPFDRFHVEYWTTAQSDHSKMLSELSFPSRASKVLEENERSIKSYAKVRSFSGLDRNDVKQLEANRSRFYELKLRILKILSRSLRYEDTSRLWPECLRELTDTLTGDEAEFYLRMDRYYLGYSSIEERVEDDDEGALLPGGLTNLLEFIGHCEKEITIGTMQHCTAALWEAGIVFHNTYGQNTWRPSEANSATEHLGTGSVNYFGFLGHTKRSQLDAALNQFIELDRREESFWEDFRQRVRQVLEDEFHDEVIITERVKRRYIGTFEPYIRTFAQWQKTQQETTGMLSPMQLAPIGEAATDQKSTFRREGDYWQIQYDGRTAQLKASKGFDYIANLLGRPGQEFHVLALYASVNGTSPSDLPVAYSSMSAEQLSEQGFNLDGVENLGSVIDARATIEVQRCMIELQKELDEAMGFNDPSRISKLNSEIKELEEYVLKAHGMGGQPRKAGDRSDKVRKAVSVAISRSMKNIEKCHPSLWSHLNHSIRTGTFISYSPESPISWDL